MANGRDLRVFVVMADTPSRPAARARAEVERQLAEVVRTDRIFSTAAAAAASVIVADLSSGDEARRVAGQSNLPLVWWVDRDEEPPEGEPFVATTATGAEVALRLRAAVADHRLVGLSLSDRRIDLDRGVVVRASASEALTATEARLLRVLVQAEGRIVSRDELLRRVWGYRATVKTRALDIALVRLRAKVEPDPSNPSLLLTVRGVGYRAGLEGISVEHRDPVGSSPVVTSTEPSVAPSVGTATFSAGPPTGAGVAGAFFGRADELRVLAGWLRAPGACVELVGPPGMGRSRLLAHALATAGLTPWRIEATPDGATLAEQLVRAAQLGPRATLTDALRALACHPEPTVWIAGVEHAPQPARQLAVDARAAVPSVRVVTTGECSVDLPHGRRLPVGGLDADASVALLRDRWQAEDPLTIATDDDERALGSLAAATDGMPLALELLAAQFGSRSPSELARDLAELFAARVGSRLAPILQRTLAALPTRERLALDVLSWFDGALSVAGAEAALAAALPDDGASALHPLIARALVARRATPGGTRLRVPRPIAAIARSASEDAKRGFIAACARLGSAEVVDGLHRASGAALLAEMVDLEPDLARAALPAADEPIDPRISALRALYHVAATTGPATLASRALTPWAERADLPTLALADVRRMFTDTRLTLGVTPPAADYLDSALAALDVAITAGVEAAADSAARARIVAGYLALAHRDVARATAHGDAAVALLELGVQPWTRVTVLGYVSTGFSTLDLNQINMDLRAAWRERRDAGDRVVMSQAALWVALPLWRQGRVIEALAVLREGVAASRSWNDRAEEARDLGNLSMLELLIDDVPAALADQEAALALMRATGTRQGLVVDLSNYAEVLHVLGQGARSAAALEEAIAELPAEVVPRYHVVTWRTAARLALAQGQLDRVLATCERGRALLDRSSAALRFDLDALALLARALRDEPVGGAIDELFTELPQIEDVNTVIRVSGALAIAARWYAHRESELRAAWEQRARAAEPSHRRDIAAVRRALTEPKRDRCDLL